MADSGGRTLVSSVLFLDIVGYTKQSVTEQQRIKQSFNDTLAGALKPVAQRDRVILDTGDGAAITFFGDPEGVLQVALAIRDGVEAPTRMGINLGPVRLVTDLNGHVNVIGDGINVAQRVMSFAEPGQLLVSRSFYEMVAPLADEYAKLFTHEGARQDKHVRAHDVYSVASGARAPRPAAPVPSAAQLQQPPEIFDAGEHLIISGYGREGVQKELDRLVELGARVQSQPAEVGNKWVASCARPDVPTLSRVAQLGNMRIITGPTREVVTAKQQKLIAQGAAAVSEVECINGVWTAVCEERAPD